MSSNKKEPTVSVPTYNPPAANSFDLFGMTSSKNGNTYSVSDPNELATMTAAKGIRSSLLQSLGLGGTPEQDPYTKSYMNEILRLAQPQTENALIGRGLGGSSTYSNALTDLITKAATQSVLGGQQYKQNNLSALNDYLNNQNTMGYNLLNLGRNSDVQNQQLAQQLYGQTLPYLAQMNYGGNNGIQGAMSGGIQGAQMGSVFGPVGTVLGALVGGAGGYFTSKQNPYSVPYYMSGQSNNSQSSLMSLSNKGGSNAFN